MKKTTTALLALTAALTLLVSGCELEETGSGKNAADREAAESSRAQKGDKAPKAEKAKPKGPVLTNEQQQAVKKAEQYLDQQAFSQSGLIDQLKFEGFSAKDATRAINTLKVNYKNQAALKAKQYLDQQSFSRSGLIDQLKFEGFNQQQAEYGATQAGL